MRSFNKRLDTVESGICLVLGKVVNLNRLFCSKKRFEIVTFCKTFALLKFWGRVDGQMINVLTFYFPLTPTVSVKFVFEKSENKQNKRPG